MSIVSNKSWTTTKRAAVEEMLVDEELSLLLESMSGNIISKQLIALKLKMSRASIENPL